MLARCVEVITVDAFVVTGAAERPDLDRFDDGHQNGTLSSRYSFNDGNLAVPDFETSIHAPSAMDK